MITRLIEPALRETKKSILLIGPRQVGKSTLISSLKPQLSIDLSDELEFMKYSSDSGELESAAESHDLIRHPKFYFFDNGVYNSLMGNFTASPDRIGVLSEQLIFTQILHSSSAMDKSTSLSSFRTRQGIEVDFILNCEQDLFAIEVKANENLTSEDCEGLIYFSKAFPKNKGLFIFHLGIKEKKWALFGLYLGKRASKLPVSNWASYQSRFQEF